MSFFPLQNHNVINFPAKRSLNFKSGMVLMQDSNGYAIKADRSTLYANSSNNLGRFLGFASGDHDKINNILVHDPVGSSYIDSNGKYIDNVNNLYTGIKRFIDEYTDENISEYYNLSDSSTDSPRGVGVYRLLNEIYSTDQFAPYTAYTQLADDTNTIDFAPGDLLTFGAGTNAGKLVKVDLSGYGPSILVVGTVEAYDLAGGILYFRHILERYENPLSLYTTNLSLSLDAGNTSSYDAGIGGTIWSDLSGNGLNAYLVNGPVWNSGGYFSLDGANDYIYVPDNNLLDFPADFSVESFYKATGNSLHAMISKRYMAGGGVGVWSFASFFGLYNVKTAFFSSPGGGGVGVNSGTTYVVENTWYHFLTTRISGVLYMYINGVLVNSASDTYDYSSTYDLHIGKWDNSVPNPANVIAARVYKGIGLTADQVRQNYHSLVGRIL